MNIPAQLEHKRTWILSPLAGEQVPQPNAQTRGKRFLKSGCAEMGFNARLSAAHFVFDGS